MNKLLDVGYRMESIGENFDYHTHHEYEIYFFHEGSCRYLLNNQIYDLMPGDIILMDGLTIHKPNIAPDQTYIRSVLHFSPDLVKDVLTVLNSEYLLDTFKRQSYFFIRTQENKQAKELETLISKLAEIKRLSDEDHPMKDAELKLLLLHTLTLIHKLTHMSGMDFTKTKSIKSEHAENIATYLQTNYMHHLTLDSISEALNLSKSYASRLFKEMTGFTIMEYVMGCRLKQSKYLLECKPTKSIKDIAYESGFENAAHFSSYFRSKVGQTAGNYRNQRLKRL